MSIPKHPVFEFFPQLTEEIGLLEQLEEHSDDPAFRRIVIRTHFAILEALGCMIRHKAFEAAIAQGGSKGFNIQKLAFLDDHSWSLSSTGRMEKKGRSDLPFARHFAFSLRTLAEEAGVSEDYIQGPGWDAFQRSVRVRNRITHPKTEEDVAITQEDFDYFGEGLRWAFNTTVDIFAKSTVFGLDDPEPKS